MEQTKEAIEKYVLHCVKFVDPLILDKTGIIAQALKENLEPWGSGNQSTTTHGRCIGRPLPCWSIASASLSSP